MRANFPSIACLLGIILSGLLPSWSWAREVDLVVGRAWLQDPTGLLSWDDVRVRPMTPFQGVLSLGFGTEPVWIRLRIDPAPAKAAKAQRLYLRIRPLYLDSITLYDPLQNPARRAVVGDRYPVSAQAEPAAAFLYELPLGEGPRDVWLSVRTTSTRLIYAEVMTADDLRRSQLHIDHLGTLYLGLIASILLWGMVQLLTQRERLMAAFVLHQAATWLLSACHLGYAYLYLSEKLPDGMVDKLTSMAVMLAGGAVVTFSLYLFKELGSAGWQRVVLTLALLIYAPLLLAVWTGAAGLALAINGAMIVLLPILNWILALLSKPTASEGRTPGLSKHVVVGYFSVVMVVTLLTALPSLGLLQGSVFSLYAVWMYGLTSGILMFLLLQRRAWLNLRRQSLMQAMADEAEARAREEKEHREERERMLAMLGHELKTPLAAVRMLMADRRLPADVSRRIDASVTDMTHVVERTVQSGQLESGRIALNVEWADLLQLIRATCTELPEGDRINIESAGDGEPVVRTDPHLFKVVLRNLLDNALKYSPPDCRVRVLLGQPDAQGNWRLEVINPAGRAGLPDPERVFEKYYRNPKAGFRSGSGLGLYLIQGLVQILGGHLRYQPGPDLARFIMIMRSPESGGAA